ncbi:von Willebrand factor A domain-containing protein 5A [Python bivittatus]|uniref:von Willebrand factor A domain-containing protein 5A n=1 Tax=Python bivittatus TaxID=176946 RepID=A0A9F5JBD1_PYTBI|nr:von Willebrand factor A domain-containing protein 5A [Python bivittatus]
MDESPVDTITEKVPLQNIAVDVLIRGFLSDVTCQLHYKNQETVPLEVEFVFPVHAEAAVYAFEGLMDGQKIESQLMKREEARTLYDTGLIMGSNVALLEKEPKSKDIFRCMLGNLPPNGEATLKLCYVQAFSPEPDGAIRFGLPVVLKPRYVPQEEGSITQNVPQVPKEQLPYTLSLNVTLDSPYRISHVESNCTLTPLQYTTEDHTIALISLVGEHHFDRDVELLIYYEEEVHKPSALLEPGKPGADPGSLMGDPVLLLTMYPTVPSLKSALNAAGEFVFLVDCSGSMFSSFDQDSPSCIEKAKETLIFLLKSLPLGSYFNIYAFGSDYYSFYSQSVRYTQKTMLESLKRVKEVTNMGGTEILQPLKAIYSQPCQEGYICQLFVFTDGAVSNTMEVIKEVQSHINTHRCFSFGIGEGVSTLLIKGIAEAGCGHAEFIKCSEKMQTKALRSMKRALQPKLNDICLQWDLPSGFEAVLVRPAPQVIFAGECYLIYAQISGQQQASELEGSVVLQYKSECQIFRERMAFSLQLQENDRLPIHRLAAQALLQDLEGATSMKNQNLALETSLSSGVWCDQTAYVLINTDLGKPLQSSVYFRRIPVLGPVNLCNRLRMNIDKVCERDCKLFLLEEEPSKYEKIKTRFVELSKTFSSAVSAFFATSTSGWRNDLTPGDFVNAQSTTFDQFDQPDSESLLLKVVSLQNADGSWILDACLLSLLGLNEAETLAKKPLQVAPAAWATVLVILWLHVHATEERDIWELLEAKALGWLHENAGPKLAQCIQIGNTFLGCDINPAVFKL